MQVYGEGADCNVRSSRVYRPDAVATHTVVCLPRSGGTTIADSLTSNLVAVSTDGLQVEEFVSMEGKWYATKPPFDCVLVEQKGTSYVFKLEDVVFSVRPASR